VPSLRRYSATNLCDGAQMESFLRNFCVRYFQRATCSTFQTYILNSHFGHTTCGSMVDIQSPTAENRRGRRKTKEETTAVIYNGLSYWVAMKTVFCQTVVRGVVTTKHAPYDFTEHKLARNECIICSAFWK